MIRIFIIFTFCFILLISYAVVSDQSWSIESRKKKSAVLFPFAMQKKMTNIGLLLFSKCLPSFSPQDDILTY